MSNMFDKLNSVPWFQNLPTSVERDTDNDGIVDALDNYYGPGANSPFESASNLPWSQNLPTSVERDTDNDGIVDALDSYYGPGANDPFE